MPRDRSRRSQRYTRQSVTQMRFAERKREIAREENANTEKFYESGDDRARARAGEKRFFEQVCAIKSTRAEIDWKIDSLA